MPPCSSGIVTPNRPSSFIWSTIGPGNLSSESYSWATGMISLSANWRTMSVIALCSSVFSVKSVTTAMAPAVGLYDKAPAAMRLWPAQGQGYLWRRGRRQRGGPRQAVREAEGRRGRSGERRRRGVQVQGRKDREDRVPPEQG